MESARQDALFSDPFAAELGGTTGSDFSAKMRSQMPWPEYHVRWVAVRTKFIDDRLAQFAGGCCPGPKGFQFVNLGSGLDARTFRLEPLRYARAAFEVDKPEVVGAFGRAMARMDAAEMCPRVGLAVDLATADALTHALLAAGFDASVPTFWLLEGLTMYLAPHANTHLLEQISRLSAASSQICSGILADTSSLPEHVRPPFAPSVAEYTQMLRTHGWTGELGASFYGPPALDFGRYPEDRAPDTMQCLVWAQRLH